MAEVFLGRFEGVGGFEKRCAIKRLHPRLAARASLSQRLLREAKLAAELQHPNIVEIFDVGRDDDGNLFIAMELVDGLDLQGLAALAAEHDTRIPVELACHVASEALEGLGHAHRHVDEDGSPLALVHRDVSPHNILVSWDGSVKLVDFGLVQPAEPTGRSGPLEGKVAYLSPEQVQGEPVDARSDLFALGVTLFEVLGGRRPFAGTNELMTMRAIVEEPPPPLSALDPRIPADVVGIVERALQKHPGDRFATAADFRDALKSASSRLRAVVDRHVLSEWLSALREGHPETFERARAPRSAGALALPGPDPYARFVPRHPTQGPDPLAPSSPAPPEPPPRRAPPVTTPANGPEPIEDEALLASAGLGRRRASPALVGVGVAALVVLAGLSAPLLRSSAPGSEAEPSLATVEKVDSPPAGAEEASPAAREPQTPPAQPALAALEAPPQPRIEETSAPTPARAVTSPSPRPRARATESPRRPRRRARTPEVKRPTLSIVTEPSGLDVEIDGRRVGRSPLEVSVTPGRHRVRVSSAVRALSRTTRLEVPKRGQVSETIAFAQARLRVLARPWATVFVDGRKRGVTPLELEVYEGARQIRLEGSNGEVHRETVELNAGEERTLRVKL